MGHRFTRLRDRFRSQYTANGLVELDGGPVGVSPLEMFPYSAQESDARPDGPHQPRDLWPELRQQAVGVERRDRAQPVVVVGGHWVTDPSEQTAQAEEGAINLREVRLKAVRAAWYSVQAGGANGDPDSTSQSK